MTSHPHLLLVVPRQRTAEPGWSWMERRVDMTSLLHSPGRVPTRRVVLGQIVRVDEAYGRELPVPPIVLFPVLLAAIAAELVGLLVGTVLRTGPLGTARRPV